MKKDIVPLPEEVIKMMIETPIETLTKYLSAKYDTPEKQKIFVLKKGLRIDLFRAFMERSDKYMTLHFITLKEYIFDECNFEIISKTYLDFLYDYGYVKTINGARVDVINRASKYPDRKIIIAIDGDNMSNELDLESIERHIREYETVLHVVLFFANGVCNDAVMTYEAREWLTITYSKTNNKDAVDGCIGVFLGSMHTSLSVMNKGSEYAFMVMSKDHFVEEISLQFEDMGRVCIGGPTFEKGMKNVGVAMRGRSGLNTKLLGDALPFKPTRKALMVSPQKDMIRIAKIVEKPTMSDMLALFRVAWIGSGESSGQFCRAHGLNATNFSKHVNYKRLHTASAHRLLQYYRIYEASSRERSVFEVANGGKSSKLTIEHEWDEGGLFRIRLDPSLFSLLCAFNSVVKRYEPIAYIEQCTVDGQYFMSMYHLKVRDQSLVIDTQCLTSQVYSTILTVPIKMRGCNDVSLKIRLCDGQPDLKLIPALEPICSQYYTFTSMTTTEYAKQNIKTSIITNDIFSESDSPKTALDESEIYTDWKRSFESFQPFNLPARNLHQVFFESIDLSKFSSINDLRGIDCLLKKVGDDYIVSSIGSLNGIETVCLSEKGKRIIKKLGVTDEEIRETIYLVPKRENDTSTDRIFIDILIPGQISGTTVTETDDGTGMDDDTSTDDGTGTDDDTGTDGTTTDGTIIEDVSQSQQNNNTN